MSEIIQDDDDIEYDIPFDDYDEVPSSFMSERLNEKGTPQDDDKLSKWGKRPSGLITPRQAIKNARYVVRNPRYYPDLGGMCLKFVRRDCWELPPVEPTAISAWHNANERHAFKGVQKIPYGAPVFSQRPNAPKGDAGHVFIAGGYNGKGQRIFRGTDINQYGRVSCFQLGDLRHRWGHIILGWTGDLNGVDLHLGKGRKRPKR